MGYSKIAIFIVLGLSFLPAGACSLSMGAGVNFGVYDPLSTKPSKSVGSINIVCPEGAATVFTITLEPGAAGNYSQRTLVNGNYKLKYNLYLNPTYTTVWGNGTSGTQLVTLSGADCVEGCQLPIYAQVPPRQGSAGAGKYTDTIIANINF